MKAALRAAVATLVIGSTLAAPVPALANQAEAKDAAKQANCKPGKVEPVKTVTGRNNETIYKIECTGGKQKDVFVLVRCVGRLCVLTR